MDVKMVQLLANAASSLDDVLKCVTHREARAVIRIKSQIEALLRYEANSRVSHFPEGIED